MEYDFNVLEKKAKELIETGQPEVAARIYLFMADGDPSLDGGYLGEKLGECYEAMGDLYAAKYWYGRAIEENPQVRKASAEALMRLQDVKIDDLLKLSSPAPSP